jgi:hypothetical protein
VASRLRGIDKGKFEGSPEFDSPLLATRQAQRLNLTEATIRRMSLAQQLAWEWAVQNEIAIDALRDNPRARIIRYGDLVDDPVNQARALLSFAGLPWHPSVEEFVATSTHYQGPDRYYQVLKDSPRAKDKWQRTLSQAEREQIMEVMRASPVGQLWPELIGERAPAPNGTTDPGWLCNLGRADADLRAASCARG